MSEITPRVENHSEAERKSVPRTIAELVGCVSNLLQILEFAEGDEPVAIVKGCTALKDTAAALRRVKALYNEGHPLAISLEESASEAKQ